MGKGGTRAGMGGSVLILTHSQIRIMIIQYCHRSSFTCKLYICAGMGSLAEGIAWARSIRY